MGLSVFGIIVFVTGLLVLNAPYRWTVYGMATFAIFASASSLTLPGNIGILPANLFLVFFALRAFNLGGGNALGNVLAIDKPGFWMLCTCVWVVFGAIAFPRLFAGSTMVFAIDRNAIDPNNANGLSPLGPVSGNLSQAIYCIGDLMTYACMRVFLGYRGGYRALAGAIMIVGGLNVFAGVLDIFSHAAGVDLLSAVKTQYANLGGWELGGLVRVSGTFSETAAFSFFTMQPFAFCVNLWLLGYRPKTTGAIAIGSGLLLLLSTSGSAYVGLGAYLIVLLLSQPQRISSVAGARKLRMWAIMLSLGTLAALYIVLFMPGVVKALSDFVEVTILSKADSQSGVERSGANTQAMMNFFDTYGLGVGVGSARTSSFIVVLLACLGVVGTTFYLLFLAKCTLAPIQRHHPTADRIVSYAARHGMFAALIVASVNAPTFFLGPCFYMFAAAAGGLTMPLRVRGAIARGAAVRRGVARRTTSRYARPSQPVSTS
ncbi:hypothetical protein [Paraburkholderia bannensis]|uniref:hypothetical protein n=1 Tax=Paraburkholderia bannensis TaxID=765414 RepID=UPI002AB687FD|nr:hypothetical protein [Paraburkholderia bannensis]